MDKGPILKLGNTAARRDFTYVSDTCRGLIATMLSDIPNGEAVNVGSGISYSILELASLIAEIIGRSDYRIEVEQARLRKLDIDFFLCNPGKLYKATGWKPKVGIHEGLQETVSWYMTHGRKWSWEDWAVGTLLFDGKA